MGIKQLYNDNLRKLPNEYGDVSVMPTPSYHIIPYTYHTPSYPLHQWPYFIFIPYFILPYPTLMTLGRNDPGTKRLWAKTTHQIRPNKFAPKIRLNDPDRNDQGPKLPVRTLWHGPIFLLNMRKLWQMKKHNCKHIH